MGNMTSGRTFPHDSNLTSEWKGLSLKREREKESDEKKGERGDGEERNTD